MPDLPPTTDPKPTASDYLNAETCVSILSHNMALDAQLHMLEWDRATMQKHVNKRAALISVQAMLVDEAERIYGKA